MKHSPWRLPGPAAWLDTVLRDFDDGLCLLLRLPRPWNGAELEEAVRRARPAAWVESVNADDHETLAAALADTAYGAESTDAALERFATDGTVAWLRVDRPLTAAEVRELADAHGRAEHRAPALVVEHHGPWPVDERVTAPTLRLHHLYGALTSLDTQVLLFDIAPELSPSRCAEIVELAAYDLDLAAELARADEPSHGRYVDLCRARADVLALDTAHRPSRSLQAPRREPRAYEAAWQTGAFDVFDGEPTAHPGLVSDAEIERCLWRGQVKTLLPMLDHMRLALIEDARRRGLYPQPSRGDTVELVDVWRALERALPGHELTRAARELTYARNDLAHLRLVDELRRQRLREAIRRARLADIAAL